MNINEYKYIAVVCALALHTNVNAEDDTSDTPTEYTERVQIIGHNDKLRTEAGAATLIG
jgi:Fe(3+) dicitrate transport protein